MARSGGPSVDVRIHSWPGPTVDVGPPIARPTVDPQLAPNTSEEREKEDARAGINTYLQSGHEGKDRIRYDFYFKACT